MHDIDSILIFKFFLGLITSTPFMIKLYVMLQSFRIYGLYNLFIHKSEIFNHLIFKKLDHLSTNEELFNRIEDSARRAIFKDVYKAKIYSLNSALLHFRESIYITNNIFTFLRHHKNLDNAQLMHLFVRLYNNHRDQLYKTIKRRLKSNDMDSNKASFVAQRFYEFTAQLSFVLRQKINQLIIRKNMYFCVLDILDSLLITIEAEEIFLTDQFLSINGKLNGISYKGYDSYHMTHPKIKTITGDPE